MPWRIPESELFDSSSTTAYLSFQSAKWGVAKFLSHEGMLRLKNLVQRKSPVPSVRSGSYH